MMNDEPAHEPLPGQQDGLRLTATIYVPSSKSGADFGRATMAHLVTVFGPVRAIEFARGAVRAIVGAICAIAGPAATAEFLGEMSRTIAQVHNAPASDRGRPH